MNPLNSVQRFNNVNTSDHTVIQETGIKSDTVMVTNNFNDTPTKCSTIPMKMQITSERLILLREEGKDYDDIEFSRKSRSYLDGTSHSIGIHSQFNIDEYRTVKLVREKYAGFGLNIKGGCEHGLPILISGLTKDGPADRSRQLFIGDAIVRIDDSTLSLNNTTHEEAIKLLKQAGAEVNLTVKHFKMVSPFLKKCWKKKETLDEAGNLMISPNNNNDLKQSEKLTTELIRKEIQHNFSHKDRFSKSQPVCVEQKCVRGNDKKNEISSNDGTSKTQQNFNAWIPLVSVDLATCFVTKYVHDSDKIRPHGFEIRWLTATDSLTISSNPCPSTSFSSSSFATSSGSSSSSSSNTSLSTPKSTDSGVGVGIKCAINSTITSVGNLKEPLGVSKVYSSAIVICSSQEVYREWFTNIDQSAKNVACNKMKLLNDHLSESEQIHFMGWINQGLPSTSSEPHRPCHHWYTRYLVIKGGDALIYVKPPHGLLFSDSNESCSLPTIRWSDGQPYLYKAHQSVLRCLKPNEYVDERENCFLFLSCDTSYSTSVSLSAINATKAPLSATKKTTITSEMTTNKTKKENASNSTVNKSDSTTVCYLSVETSRELALILNNWNRATYQSVTQLGRKTFSVTCSGRMGNLVLDWKLGFIFQYPNECKFDWSYKFSQLKTSSDDGKTTLWLLFRVPSPSSSASSITSASTTSSNLGVGGRSSKRTIDNYPVKKNPTSTRRSSETLVHSSTTSIVDVSVDENHQKNGSANSSSAGSLLYPQPTESIRSKFIIQTREIHTNQLQNLLYSIHAFLTAKVISVDQSFLHNC